MAGDGRTDGRIGCGCKIEICGRQSAMDHLNDCDCDCDQCLLARMRAADGAVRQSGWEAWYRRDAAALLAFIDRRCRTLGWQDHSEDILQDCFLIGFRNVSNGKYAEQDKGLFVYLVGIAKNRLREMSRLQRREPGTLSEVVETDPGLDADDRLYLEEVVNMVRQAYIQRSDVYQRVMHGIYVEGKSSAQLAVELGKNAGNVRAIAHRAVCEIRRHIEEQYGTCLSAEAIRTGLEVL
jgi:DNA-directed RNA polymerase specialized sigma24 family protein